MEVKFETECQKGVFHSRFTAPLKGLPLCVNWVTISRYVVRHQSKCCCKGTFLDEIHI